MNKLILSALSGALAGLPMTIFMNQMHKRLPKQEKAPLPPKQITTDVVKDLGLNGKLKERDKQFLTLLSHFSYSTIVGSFYGPLTKNFNKKYVLGEALYGMGVWAVSYLGWVPLVGWGKSALEESKERNALMIGAHLVWGTSLAVVLNTINTEN